MMCADAAQRLIKTSLGSAASAASVLCTAYAELALKAASVDEAQHWAHEAQTAWPKASRRAGRKTSPWAQRCWRIMLVLGCLFHVLKMRVTALIERFLPPLPRPSSPGARGSGRRHRSAGAPVPRPSIG